MISAPEAPASATAPPSSDELAFTPLPSSSFPSSSPHTSLTPLVCDERAISRLLELLMQRAGFSLNETASRLGVVPNSVRQYVNGRRLRPSLMWFIRFAETCGAKVTIEFPKGPVR